MGFRKLCALTCFLALLGFLPSGPSIAANAAQEGNPPSRRPFSWPAGTSAAVSITFDDGFTSQIGAGKLLLERGLRGTFYLTPAVVDPVDVSEWTALYTAGNEIGNHGLHHFYREDSRAGLRPDTLSWEIGGNEGWLNSVIFHTDHPREHSFAYPGGAYFFGASVTPGQTTEEKAARQQNACDFAAIVSRTNSYARTGDGGPNDPQLVDDYRFFIRGEVINVDGLAHVKRSIGEGIAAGKWVVLVFHGIAQPGAPAGSLEVTYQEFVDIANYIKSIESQVWVAPFIEVAREVDRQLPALGGKCDLGRTNDGPATAP